MSPNPPASFKELLSRYAAGERNFTGAQLDEDKENELTGVTLDGADFSHSFIVASFRKASLRGTIFRDANIKTCNFSGADLTDADLRGAALCATTFFGAILDGIRIGGASFHSHVFTDADRPDW